MVPDVRGAVCRAKRDREDLLRGPWRVSSGNARSGEDQVAAEVRFLFLGAKALPLTRDGRKKIGAILIKFGAEVDKSIAEGPRTKKDVRDYARAVEKAASDLANRKTRAGILERVTKQIW